MSHLAQPIQVVLVFDNTAAFDQHFSDLSKIEGRLKQSLQPFGAWRSLKGCSSSNSLGFASDSQHITLQRYDEAMPLHGFADVFANPLITHGNPASLTAIKEHQRAFLVEVGAGRVPGFAAALAAFSADEALADMDVAGMGIAENQAGYEHRLLLAQTFSLGLIQEMTPSAVHWVQSQQVFDAAAFKRVASDGFSLGLYCWPFPHGEEHLPDGSTKIGLRALGSQNLLGKMVMFAPDVHAFSKGYKHVLAFIAYCRSIGRVLEDGETMSSGTADAPVVRVTHRNDIPQLPDGYIELSFDGRLSSDVAPNKVCKVDKNRLDAAWRGARNKLNQPTRPRGGLLGRLFGSRAS